MSGTEQASAPMQSLLQDEAYLLASRGVIRLSGEGALDVVQAIVSGSLASVGSRSALAYVLDEDGCILADLFVVSHNEALLLECEQSAIEAVMVLLSDAADARGVAVVDASADWQVFGELPNQSTFKEGGFFIRYADPRWHMGARLLRPCGAVQSHAWGSELKWQGHAFKLGVIPNAHAVSAHGIDAREANLHSLGLLNADCVGEALQRDLASPTDTISQRVLPLRVEPDAFAFPTMTGQAVTAGDVTLGTVIAHRGLYGLALVALDPWREALRAGHSLCCADQQLLITWPTWLARESGGRAGPVAVAGVT